MAGGRTLPALNLVLAVEAVGIGVFALVSDDTVETTNPSSAVLVPAAGEDTGPAALCCDLWAGVTRC
jgi:hypothetical protein